jgi:hypothetical protein
MSVQAEDHSFAEPDWAGSSSSLCGSLHKAEEPTDEDQSAWEPAKLQGSSVKHRIFPDKCSPACSPALTREMTGVS